MKQHLGSEDLHSIQCFIRSKYNKDKGRGVRNTTEPYYVLYPQCQRGAWCPHYCLPGLMTLQGCGVRRAQYSSGFVFSVWAVWSMGTLVTVCLNTLYVINEDTCHPVCCVTFLTPPPRPPELSTQQNNSSQASMVIKKLQGLTKCWLKFCKNGKSWRKS